jgi:hypothetical protein
MDLEADETERLTSQMGAAHMTGVATAAFGLPLAA